MRYGLVLVCESNYLVIRDSKICAGTDGFNFVMDVWKLDIETQVVLFSNRLFHTYCRKTWHEATAGILPNDDVPRGRFL